MPSDVIRRPQDRTASRAPRFLLRYIFLAILFALAAWFQIGAIRRVLRSVPARVPLFAIATGSNIVELVDPQASAAGLHRGDIVAAIKWTSLYRDEGIS
jgi:hypothetical protein